MFVDRTSCALRVELTRGLQGFTRKGLQSRSVTAGLLIKSYKCMKEEIKLIVVLPQKSRHMSKPAG